ncbi:MAG: ATP-binding protein, partial [Oligosphaeraceae bacterium]
MKYRIFISSVQKEFAEERKKLAEHIENDPVCGRFFDVFLFERLPAKARSAEQVYLDELGRSDVYLGLFGNDYGWQDTNGMSPTQKEYNLATELNLPRLIFIHRTPGKARNPKMAALIKTAEAEIVRKSFTSTTDLLTQVSASLADFLEEKKAFRHGPFDAEICPDATWRDISRPNVNAFIARAKEARNFPLKNSVSIEQFLTHMEMLKDGLPTYAAILLFGKKPQRFLISSEVKCAHFHGTRVEKPIPSMQVYEGTLFDVVDSAVDFVLSKINFSVGTRHLNVRVPTAYEIPKEVVLEAIVNAVAHRDYTSHASVQVMLFADRLEVRNPGRLPRQLTIPDLARPHGSYPPNELIARGFYLTKYIEHMGTGTEDMIDRCVKAGLPPPRFEQRDCFTITIYRNPEAAFRKVIAESGEANTPSD